MREYHVFQAIFMSFYSKALYRDVATRWGGKAFFYLFLLLALSWIGFTVQLQTALNLGFSAYAEKFHKQLPAITIKDGVVSTPERKPYVVVDPDTQQKLFVVDTSGQYQTLEQAKSNILLTERTLYYTPEPGETRTKILPSSLTLNIVPHDIFQFLSSFLAWVWILVFPVLLIASFFYRVIEAIIYAILGKIFSLICTAELTYGQMIVVSMVAMTPAIVTATIFDFFKIHFPQQLSFYFLLSVIYILFAVIANKPTMQVSDK